MQDSHIFHGYCTRGALSGGISCCSECTPYVSRVLPQQTDRTFQPARFPDAGIALDALRSVQRGPLAGGRMETIHTNQTFGAARGKRDDW